MFTNKHVIVSTRVGKVVLHNHKEWFLISMAVVNSFVGIGIRERREMERRLGPNLINNTLR